MSRRKGTKNTNHAGQRYGRLVIVSKSKQRQAGAGIYLWVAKCDCGSEKLVNATDAMRGRVQSCGCMLMKKATIGPQGLVAIRDAGDELAVLPYGFVGVEVERLAERIGATPAAVMGVVLGKTYRHTGIGGYRGVDKPRCAKSKMVLPQWGACGD